MKSSEPTPKECRTKYQHHIAPKKKNKMQRNNLFFPLDAILRAGIVVGGKPAESWRGIGERRRRAAC